LKAVLLSAMLNAGIIYSCLLYQKQLTQCVNKRIVLCKDVKTMGTYFNPSNRNFSKSLRSEIYVDKSDIIAYTNKILDTQQQYVCVSRPRRFGKTMTADMISAYYSRGCDSKEMFKNLSIAKAPSFSKFLNNYNVIFLNIQQFLSGLEDTKELMTYLQKNLVRDILDSHQPVLSDKSTGDIDLIRLIQGIYSDTGIPIVFIIDEWDCIFREDKTNKATQKAYLDFLRNLLKDRDYVALAYMTGILPIKKYGTHSALNMFREFSMTDPGNLAEFVGFTQNEVKSLCSTHGMDYEEISRWYNGYSFLKIKCVYNPKSVIEALLSQNCSNYWSQTETYEALSLYFKMNFDNLRDIIIQLLAGCKKRINTRKFANDMITFKSCDDILTLLVHLGYLGYNFETSEVSIPNKEITDEFVTAVEDAGWEHAAVVIFSSAKSECGGKQ